MKNIVKGISTVLAGTFVLSAMGAVSVNAEEEKTVSLGNGYAFDRVVLSYKDAKNGDVKIAFSDGGSEYSEYRTVSFNNSNEAYVDLPETMNAASAKVVFGDEGMPKIELLKKEKLSASAANVGKGYRGIEGNTKDMWNAGDERFNPLFDGTFDDSMSLVNLGEKNGCSFSHDAVKDGKTKDYGDAMIELNFVFDRNVKLAGVIQAMDANNFAGYTISIPEGGGYKTVVTRTANDFNDDLKQKITAGWDNQQKTAYYLNDALDEETDKLRIKYTDFRAYKGGVKSDTPEYAAVWELAFMEYKTVYETGFEVYSGAEISLDSPVICERVVGDLPNDMWYTAVAEDGTETELHKADGKTGYFSDKGNIAISKLKIQGYNSQAVENTKIPSSIRFYGAAEDLAKKAYEQNNAAVTIDGKAENSDFGDDPRAEYMSVDKETGTASLFDGDSQYTSIHPYHPFVSVDPDRLTLKANSKITVDLGKNAIIDEVDYYAGPNYTPKKYNVLVSNSADFSNSEQVFEKEYELVNGQLSPFRSFDEFNCSMRENQKVENTEGRYIRIVNDGVLNSDSTTTIAKTLTSKNVILAKELKVIGANEVYRIDAEADKTFKVSAEYADGKISCKAENNTDNDINNINAAAAVYDTDGRLKAVKMSEVFDVKTGTAVERTLDANAAENESVKLYVWDKDMKPAADWVKVK